MNHQVIPAIIANNFKDLEEKIKKVESYVDWIQLDVMDGQLVDNITWYNPDELSQLDQKLFDKINFEAHLMTYKPEKNMSHWLKSGVKRIFFHYEATHAKAELLEQIRAADIKAGMALDIVTPITFIEQYISLLDAVLIMTVKPGRSGQVFREDMLTKIKQLHQAHPDLPIAVDGGINLKTGKQCLKAGATILCSGSYILESDNIAQAIQNLKDIN